MGQFRVNNLNQDGREEHHYYPSEEHAYAAYKDLIKEGAYDIRLEYLHNSGDSDLIASFVADEDHDASFACTNCGGGFSRNEMVFSVEYDADFCSDCYPGG